MNDLWPDALLQFEDFAQPNAMPLLKRYQDKLCCFNDDIQGTAAVTAGTLLAACARKGESLAEQRVCFVGAGSAGCGIAAHLVAHLRTQGLSEAEAKSRMFMVDKDGLLTSDMQGLMDFQMELAQDAELVATWRDENGLVPLLNVITHAKPTVLVGVSGQFGLFKEEQIRAMAGIVERPIILPLSNPTSLAEATPQDVIAWTDGAAIVATGSPFDPVVYKGKTHTISQCNNSYIFPGIGLGVIASRARRVTEGMLIAASQALADSAPSQKMVGQPLLPALREIRDLSRLIARRVARQAMKEGVASDLTELALERSIDRTYWEPEYRRYVRTSM